MTDVSLPPRARDDRVCRAIVSHALPYIATIGLIGLIFGIMFGVLASLISMSSLDLPIIALYAITGLLIGTAVAIRPVFRELAVFRWTTDGREE